MSMFYADIWFSIAQYLDSDDLFSMSATCKSAYRAFNRSLIQNKISWPLLKPKRLTSDQRDVIRKMEKLTIPVKLVCGSVGSGKTILSISYALRKLSRINNSNDKIIIVVPPNLIKMWKDTCIKYFGISPFVLHNSNSKYNWKFEKDRTEAPEEKIIIFSYKIFSINNLIWMQDRKDILIIDESHHYLYLNNKTFQEIIALSATVFKRGDLSYGITRLFEKNGNINDIIFNLDKKIIASKLLPVIDIKPYNFKLKPDVIKYILNRKRNVGEGKNDLRDMKWIPEILTHPFIIDSKHLYPFGNITVGKKKLKIGIEYQNYLDYKKLFEQENPYPWDKKTRKNFDIFIEDMNKENVDKMIDKCIKYKQCLAILKHLKERKEKTIIFDINVTYIPFLHKYLIDNGINSYLFTTHYDMSGRQKQLEKFKNDENANVLLSSIAMLGEGHNVTEANHIIFLSNCLDKNKYYQGIGRCHRFPQKKNVYVYYLFNSQLDKDIYEYSNGKTKLAFSNWEESLNN